MITSISRPDRNSQQFDPFVPEAFATVLNKLLFSKVKYHVVAGTYGTPGYRSKSVVNWEDHIKDEERGKAWQLVIGLGMQYNGIDGRYDNEAVAKGGFDFSDHAEVSYIFGMDEIIDAKEFFARMRQ